MKQLFTACGLVLGLGLAAPFLAQAQTPGVGIGTTAPAASAALEIKSTTQGLLLPRLTLAQRNAMGTGSIAAPVAGLVIFQTNNTPGLYAYDGTGWVLLKPDNLGNHTATQDLSLAANTLTGSGGSVSGIGVGVRADGGLNLGQNTVGNNIFLGYQAGQANTSGGSNVFLGYQAGQASTTGLENQYIGYQSGYSSTGHANTFNGWRSGYRNTAGGMNAFTGDQSGWSNTSGNRNAFYGAFSGANNGTGNYNVALGANTGGMNNTGSGNIFIGTESGATVDGLSNATAIGYQATVSQSNSLVLGNGAKVGIGTSAPASKLEVVGNVQISGAGNGLKFPDNSIQTTAATDAQVLSISGSTISLTNGGSVTVPSSADNLGNHTATQALNLATFPLVGNGGSTGLTIAADGTVTTAGALAAGGNVRLGANRLVGSGSTGITIAAGGAVTTAGALTTGGALTAGGNTSVSGTLTASGTTKLTALTGTGTRMVTTAADGTLGAAAIPVDTDAQQLSLSGGTLALTNSPSVTLPDASATNEAQTLSKTGSTVTLSSVGGTGGGTFTDDDSQALSISGSTISLSNGGSVTVPSSADNLGNHTATQKLDLGTNSLVGNGGSTGLTIASTGAITTAGTLTTGGAIAAGGNVNLGTNRLVGNGGSTGISIAAGGAVTTAGALTTGGAIAAGGNVNLGTNRLVGGGGSTGLAINNAGNVGIGTTAAASQKLEVVGNVQISGSGNGLKFPDNSTQTTAATDAQALSISGSTISLSNGGSVMVPSSADNLGNHTATQALNLGANALTGTGADLGTAVGVGVRADGGLNLGQNVVGNNVLLGYQAGRLLTTGSDNVLLGYQAGRSATTGAGNLFSGNYSGANTTTGSNNLFSGPQSGFANTTGSNNTTLGSYSGFYIATGNDNTVLGANSGPASFGGAISNATALGANVTLTASNTVVLGDNANVGIGTSSPGERLEVVGNVKISGSDLNTGFNNGLLFADGTVQRTAAGPDNLGNHTATQALNLQGNALTGSGTSIGSTVGVGVRADGGLNLGQNTAGNTIALGYQAGQAVTTGINNVLLGYQAGKTVTTGNNNHFSGTYSGQANTTGNDNFFIGAYSGYSNTSGIRNHFSGTYSGQANTTGNDNFFTGTRSGYSNTTGSQNQFSGYRSGHFNTTGNDNLFSGFTSGQANTTGSKNHFSGTESGYLNTTGSNNLFSGYQSGYYNTTGSNNIALGYNSGPASGSGNISNATALGANVTLTTSNTVVLGNNASVGIGTSAPTATLHVAGSTSTVRLEGLGGGGSTNRVVTVDNTGNLSAQTLPSVTGDNLGNHTAAQALNLATFPLVGNGGTSGLSISNTGNVGIGTTAPGRSLDIGSTSYPRSALLRLGAGNGTTQRQWELGVQVDPANLGDASGEYYDFALRDATSNTTRLLVEYGTGNVGIGTTSPAATLDVNGSLALRPAADVALTADNQAVPVGSRSYLRLASDNTTATARTVVLGNGSQAGQMLYLEGAPSIAGGTFELQDAGGSSGNVNLSGPLTITSGDVLALLWNGSTWLQVSYANN